MRDHRSLGKIFIVCKNILRAKNKHPQLSFRDRTRDTSSLLIWALMLLPQLLLLRRGHCCCCCWQWCWMWSDGAEDCDWLAVSASLSAVRAGLSCLQAWARAAKKAAQLGWAAWPRTDARPSRQLRNVDSGPQLAGAAWPHWEHGGPGDHRQAQAGTLRQAHHVWRKEEGPWLPLRSFLNNSLHHLWSLKDPIRVCWSYFKLDEVALSVMFVYPFRRENLLLKYWRSGQIKIIRSAMSAGDKIIINDLIKIMTRTMFWWTHTKFKNKYLMWTQSPGEFDFRSEPPCECKTHNICRQLNLVGIAFENTQ